MSEIAPVAPKAMPNILRLVMTSVAKKAPTNEHQNRVGNHNNCRIDRGGEVEPFKKQHLIDGHAEQTAER